jgi:hypothetical protein
MRLSGLAIGSHILLRQANQEDWISRHCVVGLDAEDLTNIVVTQCIEFDVDMATVGHHEPRISTVLNMNRRQLSHTVGRIRMFLMLLVEAGSVLSVLHLGEKTSKIQLTMAVLTRNRRNFRLNCQFSTFHVTIRLDKCLIRLPHARSLFFSRARPPFSCHTRLCILSS